MDPVSIAEALVAMAIKLVGHEKASDMVSVEAQRAANLAADAVAAARNLPEG